eukprot:gene13753-16221_t
MTIQKATFAAGCFWSVEILYQRLMGVVSTKVGYTQGEKLNPTYKEVCTGKTGHTEAVELQYDDSVVSYGQLLDSFWKKVDPTTLNRQGGDSGTQYRSGIYYHTESQRTEAEKSKEEEQKKYTDKIVVEILPAGIFYDAEDYHQQNQAKWLSLTVRDSLAKMKFFLVLVADRDRHDRDSDRHEKIVEKKPKKIYPSIADQYELKEIIGKGGSGCVYRAICMSFTETVAIKIIDLEHCKNISLDELRKEIQAMSLCHHPNVVAYHTSFVHNESLWVVMDYLSAGSCSDIMRFAFPHGLEESVIATILKETLKAICYFHKTGRIHRDIKAGNIIIDSTGNIQLSDFGVSATLVDTGDTSRNTFVGTPCWMAPEIMEQVNYDYAVDIWSFGITALELAKGRAPFSEYPPMKVLLLTLQNPPPSLDGDGESKWTHSFKDLVERCLQKDPSKRPMPQKLLEHKFFKHAKRPDYIVSNVLSKLPPLGDRYKMLSQDSNFAMLRNTSSPQFDTSHTSSTDEWIFPETKDDNDNYGFHNTGTGAHNTPAQSPMPTPHATPSTSPNSTPNHSRTPTPNNSQHVPNHQLGMSTNGASGIHPSSSTSLGAGSTLPPLSKSVAIGPIHHSAPLNPLSVSVPSPVSAINLNRLNDHPEVSPPKTSPKGHQSTSSLLPTLLTTSPKLHNHHLMNSVAPDLSSSTSIHPLSTSGTILKPPSPSSDKETINRNKKSADTSRQSSRGSSLSDSHSDGSMKDSSSDEHHRSEYGDSSKSKHKQRRQKKEKSRSRSRDRDRSRSRSRSRGNRKSSRERKSRNKSRDRRNKSRDRDSRNKSRDRDRDDSSDSDRDHKSLSSSSSSVKHKQMQQKRKSTDKIQTKLVKQAQHISYLEEKIATLTNWVQSQHQLTQHAHTSQQQQQQQPQQQPQQQETQLALGRLQSQLDTLHSENTLLRSENSQLKNLVVSTSGSSTTSVSSSASGSPLKYSSNIDKQSH